MRILGFSRKDWMNYLTNTPKLQEGEFTTFRMARKDRDWWIGEVVRVIYKPRSNQREVLGIATIIGKVAKRVTLSASLETGGRVTEEEAMADGFESFEDMLKWMWETHKTRIWNEPMNKLTVKWIQKGA